MTIYRKERRMSPQRLGLIGLAVVVLLAVVFLALRSRTPQSPADPLAAARDRAQEAAQGLDVFAIEYPQGGQGAERAGALDGLARARAAFAAAQADLSGVDAAAVAEIATDLETLDALAQAAAPADEVVALADETRLKLLALIRAGSPAP